MAALLAIRVPKNLILLPIEIVLLYFGMKGVQRLYAALPGVPCGECAAGEKTM